MSRRGLLGLIFAGYVPTSFPGLFPKKKRPWGRGWVCAAGDRAEQRLRMCIDGRGLGSNLVSFSKGFSKHPHILAIIKVNSEYLRFSFKLKVDHFILY